MNRLQIFFLICFLTISIITHAQNRISLSNRSSIYMDLTPTFNAGIPKKIISDDSQWLNYTTLVGKGEPIISITVEIVSGTIPEGLELQIEASPYIGRSKGKAGTPTAKIAVTHMPRVLIDNIGGGILATNHLIDLGHRCIGFIGGDIDHPSIKDRFQGYKQALKENNIRFEEYYTILTEDSMSREIGYQSVKNLLNINSNITAIFASNDAMAIGAVQYLKEKGNEVPRDISIIGFDDVEAGLLLDPPLSTIRVPRVDLGVKTMQLMVQRLKNKNTDGILIPVELVARNSTVKLN